MDVACITCICFGLSRAFDLAYIHNIKPIWKTSNDVQFIFINATASINFCLFLPRSLSLLILYIYAQVDNFAELHVDIFDSNTKQYLFTYVILIRQLQYISFSGSEPQWRLPLTGRYKIGPCNPDSKNGSFSVMALKQYQYKYILLVAKAHSFFFKISTHWFTQKILKPLKWYFDENLY